MDRATGRFIADPRIAAALLRVRLQAESLVARVPERERRWAAPAIIGMLAVAGIAFYPTGHHGYAYQTAPIEKGSIQTLITAMGTVNPVMTTRVSSQLSGQVAELFADFNDPVKKGQLLARLDPQSFEAEVREVTAELEVAQATVMAREAAMEQMAALLDKQHAERAVLESEAAGAKANFTEARLELERKQTLVKRQVASRSDLDQAQARLDSTRALFEAAKARQQVQDAEIRNARARLKMAAAELQDARAAVKQKQAALDWANLNLARATIRSPIDGVVIRRDVDVGQTVAASLQAPTLFTLAEHLARVRVEVRVDEADIGQVQPGQEVFFTVEAYPDRRFQGRVLQIRKASETYQHVVTYTVIVDAENQDLALLPGMTAVVRVVVEQADGMLKIPNAALRFTPPGRANQEGEQETARHDGPGAEQHTVWVLDKREAPVAVPVQTGPSDSRFSALMGGDLGEGARVITAWLPEP